ncbi:MAG: hypothetical protein LC104_06080 [Bacteroidales bacterium]|nr:hypothetical protein [Bacteroidales bacterium]
MTKTSKPTRLTLHRVNSDEGRHILALKQLVIDELSHALARYEIVENVQVRLVIGIHEQQGVFYSTDSQWENTTNSIGAPVGVIPWMQVYELLGYVPEGSTTDDLNINGKNN